jgi:hypothetical protein
MKLFQQSSPSRLTKQFSEIVDELKLCFKADWRNNMQGIAELVSEFANNGAALREFINNIGAGGKWPSMSGAQSFLLENNSYFYIRINIWYPSSNLAALQIYRRYLSIEECHNHNFNFFTTCVLGPGYTTDFFTDLNHQMIKKPGDKVELTFNRKLKLSKGQVLFVERDSDYHIQHWPDGYSITLNLVPVGKDNFSAQQYIIDFTTKLVKIIIAAPDFANRSEENH